MVISLPADLEAFVQDQVEAGKYDSVEAVLVEGLLALIDREATYQGRFAELRREVQVGLDALDRGESQDLGIALEHLRHKMQQRYGNP